MKRIWLMLIFVLCCVCLTTGCMPMEGGGAEENASVTEQTGNTLTIDVLLQQVDGIEIVGKNHVSIVPGEDAIFDVQIADGYQIESLGQGAIYENGQIILADVKYPTTVEVKMRKLYYLNLSVLNEIQMGNIASSVGQGTVLENTIVTLTAEPKEGVIFLGYSKDAPHDKGGTIVSTAKEYTFTITEDTLLYTNYYNAGNGRLVVYDSNGGNEPLQYYVFSNDSPFIGPNAFANKGQFTKDGYVLYGYNTKADGSGTYYGTGWSVIMPEGEESMTLYAQWLPVTETEEFEYEIGNGAVTITRYRDTHECETVVIPETIEGLPVTRIATNAFYNSRMKNVYLSRNLLTIDDNAFAGCRSLTTLYICDTISSMQDTSFANCNELQKLYMLACLDPRYSTSNNGTYKLKYQRLISAEGKKMIFQGGSSVSYGIDISTIHTMLNGEYAGVNFGCNQGTPSVFFFEVAATHMNPGDVAVFCPEYHKYQYGYNEMNTTTWQIFEGAYNAFADVDIRNYIKVFSSFATFNTNRYKSDAKTYEMYCTSGGDSAVTKFGEYNVNHNGQSSSLKNNITTWESKNGTLSLELSLVTNSYNANLNHAIDMVIEKGGKVYFSFASTMRQAVVQSNLAESHLKAFKDAVVKAFPKATVISDPGTFILDKSMFYNSYYHLSTAASKSSTELLVRDILAQFAREKS